MKTIFWESTSKPFWSLILVLRSRIWDKEERYGVVGFGFQFDKFALEGFDS